MSHDSFFKHISEVIRASLNTALCALTHRDSNQTSSSHGVKTKQEQAVNAVEHDYVIMPLHVFAIKNKELPLNIQDFLFPLTSWRAKISISMK